MTLLEAMVVLAIAVILTAIAVPSFLGLIQTNRVAGEINSLVGDLQFARSEAIKRGQSVSVCVSSDGSTCLVTANWHSGWIVLSDSAGTATASGTNNPLLRVQVPWSSNGSTDTLTASGATNRITYSRDGFAMTGAVTLTLHTVPLNATATRCVALNVAGRQTVQSPGTGSCS